MSIMAFTPDYAKKYETQLTDGQRRRSLVRAGLLGLLTLAGVNPFLTVPTAVLGMWAAWQEAKLNEKILEIDPAKKAADGWFDVRASQIFPPLYAVGTGAKTGFMALTGAFLLSNMKLVLGVITAESLKGTLVALAPLNPLFLAVAAGVTIYSGIVAYNKATAKTGLYEAYGTSTAGKLPTAEVMKTAYGPSKADAWFGGKMKDMSDRLKVLLTPQQAPQVVTP